MFEKIISWPFRWWVISHPAGDLTDKSLPGELYKEEEEEELLINSIYHKISEEEKKLSWVQTSVVLAQLLFYLWHGFSFFRVDSLNETRE